MSKPLIEVKDLKVYFKQKSPKLLSFKPGILKAVDQVSFSIEKGKTFGLVGESGSGKSTIGKAILRYHKPTGGEIFYEGTEIGAMGEKELLPYRKKMQSVFQDPYSSLDPSHTVQDIICEPMAIHKMYTPKERKERAKELIRVVGLKEQDLLKYPHEFSGGQRQRISIARALSVNPEFLFCDEPISALDVSIQAQIVNLLMKLQKERNLTMLFIAHDLSVVKYISDRIGVMYLGKIVELADSSNLYMNPKHPYTRALLSAVPIADPDVSAKKEHIMLKGDVPSAVNPPTGCRFAGRCKDCMEICRKVEPHMTENESGHYVACHLYD